jgi:hypothetical protein
MQAAGYVRNLQGSPHHTLYAQREQLRLWSRDANAQLVAVFQDETTAEDRPGLRALWASLEEFDVVVVESLDVFSANIITQELIVERLEQAGITAMVAGPSRTPEQEQPSQVALREVVRNVVSAQQSLDAAIRPRREIERAPLFLEIVPHEEPQDQVNTESAV